MSIQTVVSSNNFKNESVEQVKSSYFTIVWKMGSIVGTSVLDFFLSNKVSQLAQNGICVGNVIPQSTRGWMNSTVRVLTYPSMKIASYLGLSKYNKEVILAPLVEEIQFRYLLQQVALKELPKGLMDRVLPDHQIDFDSKKAQLLRILVTAGIFAALHMTAIDCGDGGGISQLIGGLFYSALIENGSSLTETIALHAVFNALPFILEYLGIPV